MSMKGINFDEVFGEFNAESVSQENERISKIVGTDGTIAQPCRICGRYPDLHFVNFKDKKSNPNPVYIDCPGCHCCDGEWYADKESALHAWNERNLGAKPKDPNVKDDFDYWNNLFEDIKIRD